MDFKEYFEIMNRFVLEFRDGGDWDIDQWNDSYVDFKIGMGAFAQSYIDSITPKQHVIEWGREFYQGTTFNTHTYRVKKPDKSNAIETHKIDTIAASEIKIKTDLNAIYLYLTDCNGKKYKVTWVFRFNQVGLQKAQKVANIFKSVIHKVKSGMK